MLTEKTENKIKYIEGKEGHEGQVFVWNKEIILNGKFIKTAKLKEEWDEDVENPETLVGEIKKSILKADLFTFVQKLPETEPKYEYFFELEPVAAIPIVSFDSWWKQLPKKTRQNVRNTERFGVVTKLVDFNDNLIKEIMTVYNESPVRQGVPFWHYGKNFETVKRENGTYLDRCDFIGAYYKNELIGFIRLVYSGKRAYPMQIISKIGYQDKTRPMNTLVAKAVELCSNKGIQYLTYGFWSDGSLSEFKRRNCFEKLDLPRYYIPLTWKGKLALAMKFHHGIVGVIPKIFMPTLKKIRRKWYAIQFRDIKEHGGAQ